MKNKLFAIAFTSVVALSGIAHGAVTISIKNFTSTSVGTPIVDASGVPMALNTIFASAGIFSSVPNFATASASQILALFTPVDLTPVSNTSFTGVFTGNDIQGLPYPTNFSGAEAYFVVGNAATLANSTLIAVYDSKSVYTPVDGVGNASVTLAGTVNADWVYGTERSLTAQTSVPSSAFASGGISLVSVPETSTAVLGALGLLGLLRRRR